uniref:Uncharacterized protein n=1 Tax=Rhizophagus irregularis (strain DAOM 181602 / DAOM 197198 / MUCL 43194) TaxID=747089 RepID=U9UJH8_RHIID
MDVVYLSDPAVFTDWRTISVALEKVVAELVLLTTQFISINSRIIKLESIITTPTPPSGPFNASTSFYIPASMKEWDDTIKPNSNILDISPSFAINKWCATMMDNNKHNFSSHFSPLINFGQINVNGLVSPVRQQHLLNFFLHSSFGVLSLNDTRLTSSSAKFIYQNEHSQYNFKSYWVCSSSSCPHNGVSLLLRYSYINMFRRLILGKVVF